MRKASHRRKQSLDNFSWQETKKRQLLLSGNNVSTAFPGRNTALIVSSGRLQIDAPHALASGRSPLAAASMTKTITNAAHTIPSHGLSQDGYGSKFSIVE
jgi:hypothetical protein